MRNAATRHVTAILQTAETHRQLLPEQLDRGTQEKSEAKRRQFHEWLMSWVHAHADVGARLTAGLLAKRCKYVTLQEFYAAFDLHLDWLNSQLRMPYYLVMQTRGPVEVPSGSTTWLGHRVIRRLRPPMRGMIMWFRRRLWERGGAWPENIVFADGCAYSGTCITEFMQCLALLLMHKVKVKGLQGRKLPDVHVWFLMPFRTVEVQNELMDLGRIMHDRFIHMETPAPASMDDYVACLGLPEWKTVEPCIKIHACPAYETISSVQETEKALPVSNLGLQDHGLVLFEHQEVGGDAEAAFPIGILKGCMLAASSETPGKYVLDPACSQSPDARLQNGDSGLIRSHGSVPHGRLVLDDLALTRAKSRRVNSARHLIASPQSANRQHVLF